jgi:sulfoxide reductase heme-binding subunit YedZ
MQKRMQQKYWVWALLTLPATWMLYQLAVDTATYGQTIHRSGQWSVALLIAALSVTPLRRLTTGAWVTHLIRYRRAIGVASFGYAALHTGVYLERKWGADLILKEGLAPDLATGWVALAVFLLLALTSNDTSTRLLGPLWKRLHRSVYLVAALTFAHWILATFNSPIAYIYLTALLLIEMLRLAGRPPSARRCR